MSQSAIKRRDGLHGFSRTLLALNPRLVAAKKGIENRRHRLSKFVERA